MRTTNLNLSLLLALTGWLSLSANAQKLPTVQPTGLYAPANIKIDGKAAEWDNKFQAYNKNTSVFYTMANDADNLYLVVQGTDRVIIDKILTNKLSLTVFNEKDKSMVPITISTPSIKGPYLNNLIRNVATDSIVSLTNKAFDANFKELKITGISAIPDPAISIYNDYGIKFAGRVDNNKPIL